MNQKKILFVALFLSFLTCDLLVLADAPGVEWEKTFGEDGVDISFSLVEGSSGGFALACLLKPRGANRGDLYLVLTDSNGDLKQESLLEEKCTGSSIQQTPEGGYIICGTKSQLLVSEAMVLVKTDADGSVIWSRTYYDTGGYQARDIAAVSNGGYVATGIRWRGPYEIMQDPEHQEPDAFLIRVDEQGDVLWNRTYGGLYDDRGFSVIETGDGGFLLAGSSREDESSLDKGFLVKTDSDGEVMWSKLYGGKEGQMFQSVCVTGDGGYAATGFTLSFDAQGSDYYLVRVDELGELVWSNHYGGSGDDEAFDFVSTTDGGFVLVGGSSVAMGSDRDVGVIRTDSSGEVLWEAAYGGGDHDIGYSIVLTDDNRYVIAGETRSFGSSTQIYLLRVNLVIPEAEQESNTFIPGFSLIALTIGLSLFIAITNHRKGFILYK